KNKAGLSRHLLYFAGIGLGFMLIEIAQMQRFMIFLGHPVYGLTVVLFTLLLFGGWGSFALNGLIARKHFRPWMAPLGLCAALAATGYVTPQVIVTFKSYGT